MRTFTTLRSTATTLHREVEEHNREHELDCAPHNEKTDVSKTKGMQLLFGRKSTSPSWCFEGGSLWCLW